MTLHERITAVLDGTAPHHDEWDVDPTCPDTVVDELGVVASCDNPNQARLIAAAPSLLAECARRLDPGDTDVAEVIEQVRFEAQWDASGLLAPAADLLAQVFLDPQETT